MTNLQRLLEMLYQKPINELLKELYVDRGLTIKQIAKELEISSYAVWSWLKEFDICKVEEL